MTLVNNTQGGAPMNIFVFGSNLAGRHGRGAALAAVKNHGAKYGQGSGLAGSSYAIPTKDESIRTLPMNKILTYVEKFIEFAAAHPEMTFNVTKIGCGLAGYKPAQIGPMFAAALKLPNVFLPKEFGGTRDVFTDKDGEELLGDASSQSPPTEISYIHNGVIMKDSKNIDDVTDVLDDKYWSKYETSDSNKVDGVIDANADLQEREGAWCKLCGVCQPDRKDRLCQNDIHVNNFERRLPTLEVNPALIFGPNDTVSYNEDDELTTHRYKNEKGFTVVGRINPRPSTKTEKAFRKNYKPTAAEIAAAENSHIHKNGCRCVACTIGGIVYFDDDNQPTGATRSDPMGMGDSFEMPSGNEFQQSTRNVQEEFLLWHKTNGLEGIDPQLGDWMMRIDARKKIVNANFEYGKMTEITISQTAKDSKGVEVTTRVVPMKNFVRGESWIHKPYGPRGTKEELESANAELMGLAKVPCDCMKQKNYKGCDCVLKIDTSSWNKSRIKTSDGHQSICMGDYYKSWQWFSNPWIGFPSIDWNAKEETSKTEMTPWQKAKMIENGLEVPDWLSYDQAYKIVSNLFVTPPRVDESKKQIETWKAQIEHLQSHKSGDLFNPCEECGMIYAHIEGHIDSESGKETPTHDEITFITNNDSIPVPKLKQVKVNQVHTVKPYYWACHVYPMMAVPQQVVEVQTERHVIESQPTKKHLLFNANGNITHPVRLAIVGTSRIVDWKLAEMTAFVREYIVGLEAEFGENLVIVSGGAEGIDSIAESIAKELGIKVDIILPDQQEWSDGKWNRLLGRIEIGYRTRNLMIAKKVCRLVNIVGAANKESVICKHCHKQHYSSGGCWTAKQAFMAGADVQTKEI